MSRMRTRCKREWQVNDSWYIGCSPKDTAKIRWTNCVLQIFSQKKMHFSYFLATRARLIHFSTFPRIAVPWFLAHNNYIIYNIIMGILSTHTDVWKCEIVKIPLTPRPFSLSVKNCIFPPYSSQNLLSRFVYLRFFSYLCTKFGMFPLGHKKEHAIRKFRGKTKGAKDGEEKDKILLRDVHFHIF